MTSKPPRSIWRALLVLSALAGASCTSRTLPLPPPAELDATAMADQPGMVRVTGLVEEDAFVGVLNNDNENGVILQSEETGCNRSCEFEAIIEGEVGDEITAWQFYDVGNPAFDTVD